MLLKNKKTGEIVDLWEGLIRDDGEHITIKPVAVSEKCYIYHSLAELNEDWEDAPEPKEYYFIRDDGSGVGYSPIGNSTVAKRREEIGNYFETEEEVEKAVERLRAWKRLKDKGFRFIDHIDRDSGQGMTRYEWDGYVNGEDLDLLFSEVKND